MRRPDPALEEFARATAAAALGRGGAVVGVTVLGARDDQTVLEVALARPARRVVLKVSGPGGTAGPGAAPRLDVERTAAVLALARRAGASVPPVLAADGSCRSGPWQYLLLEHVEGVEWRAVRPLLGPDEVAQVHREVAEALLAAQSVDLPSFGELDAAARPAGLELLAALHRRADLLVVEPGPRAELHELLEREAALFTAAQRPTLTHDDLHHGNVVLREDHDGWHLAALLDWDEAWAGPAESDVARMAFWDDMTGPGFWEVYRAAVPAADGEAERALFHQLLWCLERDDPSPRHAADTADLRRRLRLP